MANTRDGSKSKAISEHLAENKEASPQQIVDALKVKGVDVSFGLARAVKYGKKTKKKVSARKARKSIIRSAGIRSTTEQATTGSESIRQFIARNPKAGPKAIEAGLKAEGVIVSKHLISAVKYSKAKKKSGRKKTARRATVHVAARATRLSAMSVDQLLEVKRFADASGGMEQVRQALDMLEQLR
jgi:hypothetical protein